MKWKRVICLLLCIVLTSSGALAYNPGGGGSYSKPKSTTNNRGTNLGRGYRIGIGHIYTKGFKVDSEEEYRDSLEAWLQKNYVPVDNSKKSIYIQVVSDGASKDNSNTKLANDSTGQPTTSKPKLFKSINRNATQRDETNVVYKAMKDKGLITLDYFNKIDKPVDAKSMITLLKKAGVTMPSKDKALQDIAELLATDTKISVSSRRWIAQVENDGTPRRDYQQMWGQLTAILTLYIALGDDLTNKAFKENMCVFKNADDAFSSDQTFPVIAIESVVAFNDGSSQWWCSIPEGIAYAFKVSAIDFFWFDIMKNKSILDTIEAEIKAYAPKDRQKLDTFTWPATFTLYMFDKGYKYNNGNPKLQNVTCQMGREWVTAITAIKGTELYGYQVISDVFRMPPIDIPQGECSWDLSETGSHDVTKEKRIKADNTFTTKLSITNFNIAQTEKKYNEYMSYFKYNGIANPYLEVKISRLDSTKKVSISKAAYLTNYREGKKFDADTTHLTASKSTVKSYSKIDGSYVDSTTITKIPLTAQQLKYMLNPNTKYNRKLKMIQDKVNIDFNTDKRVYFGYALNVTLHVNGEASNLETITTKGVNYTATHQDNTGKVEVNYYYDDVLEDTKTISANKGDIVKEYDPQPKEGFNWSYTEPAGEPNVDGNTYLEVKEEDNIINVYYYSKPKTYEYNSTMAQPYAEVKSGILSDSGAYEQFEAMAGFPTTEDLFFASGGNEYLVQLKYEYAANKESSRTYTRKSTESRSASYIPYSKQSGAQDAASPGSAPAPLTSTDSSGKTYTTNWFAVRVAETKWDWKAEATATVPSHKTADAVPPTYDSNGNMTSPGSPAQYCGGATKSKTTTKSNSATPGPAAVAVATCPCGESNTVTVQQTKVKATAWNWEWRNYGHANEYTASDSESLPYTDNKTFSNSKVETKEYTDNGKYYNITTTVNNASESCVMRNISKTGVMSHIISWDQPITDFNYAKITDCKVWKLSKAKLDGTYQLSETDDIIAEVQNVDDSCLYNIAQNDTAKDGRLWHTLKSADQDEYLFPVYSSSGQSENTLQYAAGKSLKELSIDKMYNDTYCISDYLILRTSTGDLSMVYFDYNADNKTVPVGVVTLSGSNNGGSYSIKSDKVSFKSQKSKSTEALICTGSKTFKGINLPEDGITYGGYNGNYSSPSTKYISKSGFSQNIDIGSIKISDSTYSQYKGTSAASSVFKLVKTFDVNDTKVSNGEYDFTGSEVFYENIINYGADEPLYSVDLVDTYSRNGFTEDTTYSPKHSSINSVVVHNPTSSQYALLIPLDASRDQRTSSSLMDDPNKNRNDGKCTGDASTCPYSHLHCEFNGTEYHTEECYDYEDVEYIVNEESDGATSTSNSKIYNYTGSVQEVSLKPGTYRLEAYGAQGGSVYRDGDASKALNEGGKGGYAQGTLTVTEDTKIYLYVGGKGQGQTDPNPGKGGWNGGGSSNTGTAYSWASGKNDGYQITGGGGGATDIRLNSTSVANIIIVAGGGGGADMNDNWASYDKSGGVAGVGGGESGTVGMTTKSGATGIAGTQSGGYMLHKGSDGVRYSDGQVYSAASGGGYYGGKTTLAEGPGCGGSGYVSTSLQSKILLDGTKKVIDKEGNLVTGNSGDGFVRITEVKDNATLTTGDTVKYECINAEREVTLNPGTYEFTVAGASGGDSTWTSTAKGGKGYKITYKLTLDKKSTVKLDVGGKGADATASNMTNVGGYGGGGYSWYYGAGGGGRTTLKINDEYIVVAGGGGGARAQYNTTAKGGDAGYLTGESGENASLNGGGQSNSRAPFYSSFSNKTFSGTTPDGEDFGYGGGGGAGGAGYLHGRAGGYWSQPAGGGGGSSGVKDESCIVERSVCENYGDGFVIIKALDVKTKSVSSTTKTYKKRTLVCEEPHHSANSNWHYYVDGWILEDGTLYEGTGTKIRPPRGNVYYDTATITDTLVLIKVNGEYMLAEKSNPYKDIVTGETLTLDKYTENGASYSDCIWPLTDTDGPTIHTKTCLDSSYHYTFGDDTCWDPCNNDANHKNNKPATIGGITYDKSGEFVNLDYGFQVYFPNIGDFYGNGAYGIGEISNTTGKGYTSPMDTTLWLKNKYVSFGFPVIYDKDGDGDFSDDKLYLSNEPIPLGDYSTGTFKDDNTDGSYIYNFYVPLADLEEYSASVEFYTVATNSSDTTWVENNASHNFVREDYRACHDSKKTTAVDVVGRIGGLTMQDSGDFRFANLFKQATEGWLVENIVRNVDVSKQNYYMADPLNIRGVLGDTSTNGLNTYGTQSYKNDIEKLIKFPLTPNVNNIISLQKQPQRVGYMNYLSLETIGNYYGENEEGSDAYKTQITPYYYALDLTTGSWSPVDVYMKVGESYRRINKFDNSNPTAEYEWFYSLNWEEESKRRQYTSKEKAATDDVIDTYTSTKGLEDGTEVTGKILAPSGKDYLYGTAQRLFMKDKNRTFFGTQLSQSVNTNPGDVLSHDDGNGNINNSVYYSRQGQRWNFSLGLPSSAVFVKTGEACTTENINKIANNHTVIVCALEILARGEVWTLKYSGVDPSEQKIQVLPEGPTYVYKDDPNGPGDKPIVTVYSANKTSKQDLDTKGTH